MASKTESLPTTMKVAQISEYGKPYSLGTKPLPKIRSHELLIRIHAAGFCHSDLQTLQGQFNSPLGMVASHEPAGVVVQVGDKCSGGWAIGDRIGALNFKNACGACSGCRLSTRDSSNGHDADVGPDPRFCDRRETAGFQHDGAFAEYMVADPATSVRLPESLSFQQAAPLMCAGATVWGSLEKATARLTKGEVIAIVGIGGLGHLGVQFAAAMGFRVVAVDNRAAGRQLAVEVPDALKPALVLDSTADDARNKIRELTQGEGLAAAVVCTDSLAANAWTLGTLRTGATMGVLGLPPENWRFDPSTLVFRELTIQGTYVASRASTQRMMDLVEKAGVRSHITAISFEQIPNLVQMYQEATFKGRLVVNMVHH